VNERNFVVSPQPFASISAVYGANADESETVHFRSAESADATCTEDRDAARE
jgi:hypothetical protein